MFIDFLKDNALIFFIFGILFLVSTVVLVVLFIKRQSASRETNRQDQLALNEVRAAAENANNIKSAFLASISHDLRTPMNAIIGLVAIAGANLDNKEKLKDCLKKINSSSNHLLGLINNILDMNKIATGDVALVSERFELDDLMNELFEITKPLSDPKNLMLQFPNFSFITHKSVIGDRNHLSQIFMNILSNAFKYTPDGGRISVQIHEAPTINRNINCYEFSFSDTGSGIAEDELETIFQPFTRDDKTTKTPGIGLGLAISKSIAEMMGGNITVKSKPNEGSTFIVTLFLESSERLDAEEAAKENDGTNEPLPTENYEKDKYKGKKALLVEDIDLTAEIESEILKMTGLTVEQAANGQEAITKIFSKGENYYDIVFMDIQMPVMNGYEATRSIRSQDSNYAKHIPIVAMTANTFADDIANAKSAGMNEHVAKPLQFDLLLKILERWL